ncbi:MAG: hypothetical protein H6R10_3575 [Rhodocyclaceae bacterium]|nr:hypothetical protein [Rhodocyclaceae bacterium]
MAAIAINDLPLSHALDRKALSAIRGGGAPWVFGWIRPYIPAASGPVAPVYEINNFYADQIINQFQVVNIDNSAAAANIKVDLGQRSANSEVRPPA